MKKRHILVADDEQNMLNTLEFILEAADYHVSIARNGDEALKKINECEKGCPFDLLITDIQMPGVTGLELIKRLNRLGVKIPIVVISSYGIPDEFLKVSRENTVVYLAKPIEDEALVNTVKMLLKENLENIND